MAPLLSEEDQAIVREVMGRIYKNFDKSNLVDNDGARDAMLNTGIETVSLEVSDYEEVRDALMELNGDLAREGMFSEELYNEMLTYIAEYRDGQRDEAGPAN